MKGSKQIKAQIDRFLHTPQIEAALIVPILSAILLVLSEVVMERAGFEKTWIYVLEDVLTGVFLVELGLRYWVARNKRLFFGNYWLDLIAVLPFYHALRLLRILRLLRLLRIGILLNRNLKRISSTLAASLGIQIGILLMISLIILAGGLSIYLLEGHQNDAFSSLSHSLWWSFFTLASGEPIGGEPITEAGRLITISIILGGLTVFAIFTGVFSALMMQKLNPSRCSSIHQTFIVDVQFSFCNS